MYKPLLLTGKIFFCVITVGKMLSVEVSRARLVDWVARVVGKVTETAQWNSILNTQKTTFEGKVYCKDWSVNPNVRTFKLLKLL